MITVYGVEFESKKELFKVLKMAAPSKEVFNNEFGGSLNKLVDIRLHLDGYSYDAKNSALLYARDNYYKNNVNQIKAVTYKRRLNESRIILSAAIRYIISNAKPEQISFITSMHGGIIQAHELKQMLDRYCVDLNITDAIKDMTLSQPAAAAKQQYTDAAAFLDSNPISQMPAGTGEGPGVVQTGINSSPVYANAVAPVGYLNAIGEEVGDPLDFLDFTEVLERDETNE